MSQVQEGVVPIPGKDCVLVTLLDVVTDHVTETYLREKALVLTHDSGNCLSWPGRRGNRNVSVCSGWDHHMVTACYVFKDQEAGGQGQL